MTGYEFTVRCLYCSSSLDHCSSSHRGTQEQRAVAHCPECGSDFILEVRLAVLSGPAIRETIPKADSVMRNPNAPMAGLVNDLVSMWGKS